MGLVNASSDADARDLRARRPAGRRHRDQLRVRRARIDATQPARPVRPRRFILREHRQSLNVSGNDLLQYWEADDATDVILLYLESFGNPRRFARIARRVARRKPIVAVKSGRTPASARAASSHTAAWPARTAPPTRYSPKRASYASTP